MRLGVVSFNTEYTIRADELAVAAEERGFDSVWFPEHTHIPACRRTPFPAGGELPREYVHMSDPFISCMAAAAATTALATLGILLAGRTILVATGLRLGGKFRLFGFLGEEIVVLGLVNLDINDLRRRGRRQFLAGGQLLDPLQAEVRRRQLVIGVQVDPHTTAQLELGQRMAELSNRGDHSEQLALLERQLADLDRYALSEEQLAELNDTHKRLANAGQLVGGSSAVSELIDGDSEFAARRALHRARHELAKLAELDPTLAAAAEQLESVEIQLGEVADTLARYQDGLELDPERLQECEAQLSKLHELARRHRLPMQELGARAEELRSEVDALRNAGSLLQELERERQAVSQDYRRAAQELSSLRRASASGT